MDLKEVKEYIARGRTDLVFDLMTEEGWLESLNEGPVQLIKWLIYYDDLTAIKALMANGADLSSIDLNQELGDAAFYGHWKMCDFLINQGADPKAKVDKTGETPLHNALSKAGRPYYIYTVRILVENGADVNAKTISGVETGAFMRDVRVKGETPLHRAAAYADAETISYLIENGADVRAKDDHGDSPLSWASFHLRTGEILSLLSFDDHRIGPAHVKKNKSDHGHGWGNSMDWNLFGDYLPDPKRG